MILGMILMCVGSIGVIHGSKVWKNVRKHTFWAFPSDLYRYKLNLYRYNFGSGHFWPSSTGTTCSGFPVSTSFCILAITCSFLIRFE